MKLTRETRASEAVQPQELRDWLLVKIDEAQTAVACRAQAERTYLSGDDASWAAAAEIHPSTRGKPMKKAERMLAARIESRIAAKCRRELEMFKAVLKIVETL